MNTTRTARTYSDNPAEMFRQVTSEIAAQLYRDGKAETVGEAIETAVRFVTQRMAADRPSLLRKVHAAFEAEAAASA